MSGSPVSSPQIAEQEEGSPWRSAVFSRNRIVITELTDTVWEEKGSHNYLPSGLKAMNLSPGIQGVRTDQIFTTGRT